MDEDRRGVEKVMIESEVRFDRARGRPCSRRAPLAVSQSPYGFFSQDFVHDLF